VNGTDPDRLTDLTDLASRQEEAFTAAAIQMALRNNASASIWARIEAAEAAEAAEEAKENP
jgi:hypothetical protein